MAYNALSRLQCVQILQKGEAVNWKELEYKETCAFEGSPGHWYCGVCPDHEVPRAKCGCALQYGLVALRVVAALAGDAEWGDKETSPHLDVAWTSHGGQEGASFFVLQFFPVHSLSFL